MHLENIPMKFNIHKIGGQYVIKVTDTNSTTVSGNNVKFTLFYLTRLTAWYFFFFLKFNKVL